MNLRTAYDVAQAIVGQLAPLCLKIEVAGSIRRARPECGDIDLVILPKPGQLEAIKQRCALRCAPVRDGQQNCIFRMPELGRWPGAQLDIFFAHAGKQELFATEPSNFGSLLLCRTGSLEHNIHIVQLAKQQDKCWSTYRGLLAGGEWVLKGQKSEYEGGEIIASETEEEIFKALGIDYVPPAARER